MTATDPAPRRRKNPPAHTDPNIPTGRAEKIRRVEALRLALHHNLVDFTATRQIGEGDYVYPITVNNVVHTVHPRDVLPFLHGVAAARSLGHLFTHREPVQ